MKHTYLIDYVLYCVKREKIAEGKFKVKNQISGPIAEVAFEKYLKKKYPNFGRLLIIKTCWVETTEHAPKSNPLDDMFGQSSGFGDIFGDAFKGKV